MRGDAGDVDDAAAPARTQARAKFLTRQHHAADEVEIEVCVPVLQRDLLERALGGDSDLRVVATGGVHENRRRAELALNGLMRGSEARPVHGIGGEEGCGPAGVADFFTRASPRSALRPSTATFAPAAARPSANAPPNTPVAPMTTATSPLRSKRFIKQRDSATENAWR